VNTGSNSNRAALWAALFCLAGLGAVGWSYLTHKAPSQASGVALDLLTIDTKAGPKTFKIEVALTNDQQATGLMFRTKLAEDEGMLFPHDEPREVTMWMRNTYVPLDMVFIRTDGIIHRIEANTEPMSERIISSNGPVGSVLEIVGGTASKLGIAPGDSVRHSQLQSSAPGNPAAGQK
jgi:uncharacterized protein